MSLGVLIMINTVSLRTPDVRKTPFPVYRTNEILLYKAPDLHTLNPLNPDSYTPDPRTPPLPCDILSGILGSGVRGSCL